MIFGKCSFTGVFRFGMETSLSISHASTQTLGFSSPGTISTYLFFPLNRPCSISPEHVCHLVWLRLRPGKGLSVRIRHASITYCKVPQGNDDLPLDSSTSRFLINSPWPMARILKSRAKKPKAKALQHKSSLGHMNL